MGKTRELRVNGNPGLTFVWGHQRRYPKYIAKGYREATESDINGGDLVCGELMLFVKPDAPSAVKVKQVDKAPTKYVHVDGLKIHWVHTDKVKEKLLKGYHVVAKNEIVGMGDSIDAITNNGHLLMAKKKGDKNA